MGEGVIKYDLQFKRTLPLPEGEIHAIESLRQRLRFAGVLGQDPDRYGGFGYGNVSKRLPPFDAPPSNRMFLITGTQTGAIPGLSAHHYSVVSAYDLAKNQIVAQGMTPPSSESLTHATLYSMDESLRWVLHVHAPTLWIEAAMLRLPVTNSSVLQGTLAMCAEVRRLFEQTDVRQKRIFAMGGHKDGMVAFGRTAEEASEALFKWIIY